MKDVFIFGTCRVCYMQDFKDVVHVQRLREHHSHHYRLKNINIFTEPVNYTTKLIDVLDSLKYMTGSLYQNLNPFSCGYLQSIFFRGHTNTNWIMPQTHPLEGNNINFGKVVLEMFSIKKYTINTEKYGIEFYGKNLPWKIKTGYEHNNVTFNSEEINTHIMSQEECFNTLDEIKQIVKCPILIVGPYESKKVPKHVNIERAKTQDILREYCSKRGEKYFDLSQLIKDDVVIESDETHFTNNYELNSIIYDFILS